MSSRALLRAVRDAEDSGQFWAVQDRLRFIVETEERLITRRRDQASRLVREKRRYARSPGRSIDRIKRFEDLISTCRSYADQHTTRRGIALYMGDTLAFKLLPEHFINVMCQNVGPGFFGRKEGRKLEVQAAEFVVGHGDRAVLNDLTHCLRIGDLTFVKEGFPPVIAEFGSGRYHSSGHQRRKERQHERLRLLERVLNESIKKEDAGDLLRYSFPAGFIAQERHFTYHVQAFEQASRLRNGGYTVLCPEAGLVYLATAPDCPSAAFMPEFMAAVRPGRCAFEGLRKRLEGNCPWVAPLTLLPISEDVLVKYFDQEFNFYVYLDLGHVGDSLKKLGVPIKPTFDGVHDELCPDLQRPLREWFTFEVESRREVSVRIGPKILHRVLFGLATIESAVNTLAQMADAVDKIASKVISLFE